MTRLTVLYGHPDNPAEFDRYYHEVHIPLAKRMKGLKGWTIGKCQGAAPGEAPPYYMIVGLYAESRQAMEAILESAEGKATVADLANFATGGAKFFYDEEVVLAAVRLE
ncbi:MAG TPA: EthD family reductase [Caulifigura sp.]|nr:EthD family reductase [Caulifigura sp.]